MMCILEWLVLCIFFLSGGLTLGLKVEDANTTGTKSCIKKERQTLLVVKANLVDINGSLHDWGSEEEKRNCCKWLGVLCNNQTGHVIELDLSIVPYGLAGNISSSLSLLNQLQYLNLNGIDFQSNPIPNSLSSLTNLQRLDISSANLSGPIPHQLSNLSNLLRLNLSGNSLEGSIPFSLGDLTSLTHLDLSRNHLEGVIPESFGSCSSLVQLDLSKNFLNGSLPNFVECSSMKELILDHNRLTGGVANFTGWSSLTTLSLGHNSLNGSIPNFTGCKSLLKLDLSNNQLTGNLPNSVGQLLDLRYLDVYSNSLEGVISDVHILNLTKLLYLDLSFNSFSFDLSSDEIVPFQLMIIKLQSCKLGPRFPTWIKTQNDFLDLDISSAGISDSVPTWFWDLPVGLQFLNISSNEIKGVLPNIKLAFDRYPGIDLSNNKFEGRVPLLPSKLAALNLSGNRFNGSLNFLCQIDGALTFLDLSNNSLSGTLPDCWSKFQEKLVVLVLSNNNLSGEIPSSLGFLSQLEALYLRNNAFVGELPMSLSNCTNLRFMDLGKNTLSGKIPMWIGERLSELYVLALRSNKFHGDLPPRICWLNNLQFLDLSKNGISGNIPGCFGNFTAMATRGFRGDITNHSYSSYIGTLLPVPYDDETQYISYGALKRSNVPCSTRKGASAFSCSVVAVDRFFSSSWERSKDALFIDKTSVAWKGKDREFGRGGLQLLKSIDLSDNMLSGRLPYEITSLGELVSFNTSNNKLHGEVPKDMGRLKSLQSLDLSTNGFSGNIPSSLSELTSLGYLDLSNNDFSGRIPVGPQLQTFDASFYGGNPQLCGAPLTKTCGIPPATTNTTIVGTNDVEKEDGDDFWKSYYIGISAGFAIGFWGICGALFLNCRFNYYFFASLSRVNDWIYVMVAVHFRKLQTKFTRF